MKRKIVGQAQSVSLAVLLLLGAVFSVCAEVKPVRRLKPTVILISLDGFRYDYLTKYKPPHLNLLARKGVRARWLIPSFPTKTYPNHYTIATGLYPQNHGIVENSIYDRELKAVFTLGNRAEVESGRWWLGEPIWVTAEKQGQKSGSIFFPGTETEIAGRRPTFWKRYDEKMPNAARVDAILSWLDLPPAERPTCLSLYFSDVDDAGHASSPDSVETGNAVARVDGEIGRLIRGLEARKIFGKVNLIIVSDHGMAKVNFNNAILLDEIFDTALAERIFWTSEIVQIFPRVGREEQIYSVLKTRLPRQAQVYRKSEIPERFHYRHSPRIAPLVVLPEEGWILTNRQRFEEMRKKGDLQKLKGAHGYDNALESMRAIFIAHGAAFKRGKVVEPFENIHVYNIMARILGLTPAKNDGNRAAARQVLR
ncbi:MAG TPA: ectonucleotide pyrophosphatase/phosphodiesterase [Pyrinomonadaceae bacterium]|jgi:predicted AlkP superfamily pyrophosphatase or phosphodiesterase